MNPHNGKHFLKKQARAISTYLVKKTGFTVKTAKTGAVTLIQRFGSALNLNIHFHMLFLDGVYEINSEGAICQFHGIKALTSYEMSLLLHRISKRLARLLERAGYLEREDGGCLTLEGFEDEVMNHLQGSSITYRVAVGSQQGRKVLTLKTLPSRDEFDESAGHALAKAGGFSLHAGVSAKANQRGKVERLCRYIARPAVSLPRLERLSDGTICYELKTPYKNGTTHVVFEPLDFIARLTALVPKPRVHLTRFHGVFAPNSCLTLEELDQRVKSFILDEYNNQAHSITKIAPILRWQSNLFLPQIPESQELLDLLLLTVAKPRKVHRDGIKFQGFRYFSTTLAGFVGEPVIIRYDPRDLAEIHVFYKNNFLCRAISQDLDTGTVSLKEIVEARSARKRELQQNIKDRCSIVDALLQGPEKIAHKSTLNQTAKEKDKQHISGIKRYKHE